LSLNDHYIIYRRI